MALQQTELFSGVTRGPSIRMAAEEARPVVFAIDAGAALLAPGTPVHHNGTNWIVWADTTAEEIMGFVYFQGTPLKTTVVTPNVDPASGTVVEGVQLSATEEVHGIVMMKGRIHYDDIVLPAGEMQADLDVNLKTGPMARGLIVVGLDGVH